MLEHLALTPPFLPARAEVCRLLGYPNPKAVGDEVRPVIDQMLAEAAGLIVPWAGFAEVELAWAGEGQVRLRGGTRFESARLAELLTGCRAVVVSAVTIDEGLEQAVARYHDAGQEVESVILDAVGSAAVERLQRALGKRLCVLYEPKGWHVTRHYSPGYTGWDLREQQPLFDRLRLLGGEVPIRLNDSQMMIPRKSLSSVWGVASMALGEASGIERLPCRSCDLESCRYRRAPYAASQTSEALAIISLHGGAEGNPDEAQAEAQQTEEPMVAEVTSAPSRVKPVEYPIATKALAKWMRTQLGCQAEPDGALHYTFAFMGSTCSGGGIAIPSTLHALIRERPEGMIFERGWVELSPDDNGVRSMCEYNLRGEELLEELRQSPPWSGQTLEALIDQTLPLNPAGCFCKPAMVQHKWRQFICTIHYALSQAA